MATEISLNILGCDGAGKKTLVGSLIYKCGLGLPRLKELERESISQIEQIVPFYEKKGYAQTFYAPPGLVTVQKSQTPDYVIWVVDGPDLSTWNSSAEKLRSLLFNGDIQPRKKLIIAVNKMDFIGWSEQTFKDIVHVFRAARLHNRTFILPISGLKADNLLPDTKKPSWAENISPERYRGLTQVSDKCLTLLLG
ncbi:hypothetical protein AU210_015693 [Fusarium oxysporum f. sp. radicis-cucumerinum]|uniref:Uncharacterized protein n=1 Tax=Fusarium oxysporum f. sp. radicis-cucumerinum TaxID=327505 RepID=A0A2H3FUM5_FUSOX|nr:hypothetical protein AU210_015693 [Fusarium oxysporum f. sp. radicis-cucumerinum]